MELNAAEEKKIELQESVFRLERRAGLLQKECDSLKAMLASYSTEVLHLQPPHNPHLALDHVAIPIYPVSYCLARYACDFPQQESVLLERNQRNVRAGTAPSLEISGSSAKQERITSLEAALADALAKVCDHEVCPQMLPILRTI